MASITTLRPAAGRAHPARASAPLALASNDALVLQVNAAGMERLQAPLDLGDFVTKPCRAVRIAEPEWLWPRNPPIRARADKPTISYAPTAALRNRDNSPGELRPSLDYSGQTYWLSADVNAMRPAAAKPYWPSFVRVSAGHSITDWIDPLTGANIRAKRKILLTLDFDATLVDAHSEKQCAKATYKRGFGFHPLLAYLDATREPLACLLRPGNAGSGTATSKAASNATNASTTGCWANHQRSAVKNGKWPTVYWLPIT